MNEYQRRVLADAQKAVESGVTAGAEDFPLVQAQELVNVLRRVGEELDAARAAARELARALDDATNPKTYDAGKVLAAREVLERHKGRLTEDAPASPPNPPLDAGRVPEEA